MDCKNFYYRGQVRDLPDFETDFQRKITSSSNFGDSSCRGMQLFQLIVTFLKLLLVMLLGKFSLGK